MPSTRISATSRTGTYGLMAALILLATSGCGRMEALSTVDERPTSVTEAPACGTAPNTTRGWHYRAQLDMGESPPSSSQSSAKSAVSRTIRTSHVDAPFTFSSALAVLLGLLLCVVPTLGLAAGAQLVGKRLKLAGGLAVVAAGLSVVTLVVGYASGSVISVDNPTPNPVQVTLDGSTLEVPANSFTEARVLGPSVDIRTESAGQLIEELTLELDDHPGQTLFRALFGDGRYIYDVCGAGSYSLGHFSYR